MVNETLSEKKAGNEINSAEILTDMPSFLDQMAEIAQENQETSVDKETDNTVRKAESLKSLEELGLPEESCRRLMHMHKTVDDAVLTGRKMAFCDVYYPKRYRGKLKPEKELVSALENEGFIRPASDFRMAHNLDALYCCVYGTPETKTSPIVPFSFFDRLSNEGYENFKGISDDKIEEVKSTLSSWDWLPEREYKIICWSFGLDGDKKSDEDIAKDLGIRDKNYTREIRRRTLGKMERKVKGGRYSLPPLGLAGF